MSTTTPQAKSESETPVSAPTWSNPERAQRFAQWLDGLRERFALHTDSVRTASADASFRRYLRVDAQAHSLIIMDAPPEQENSTSFVQVAGLMKAAGIHVPEILDWDAANGFMLLTDLGTHTMLQGMDLNAPPPLDQYLQAVDILVQWQRASQAGVLPEYDHALLRREVELLPQWYIQQYRQRTLSDAQQTTLNNAFETIIQDNLRWPQVFVHRDFMPRNLMLSAQGLGVLDFQDAVYGPITYDIASLMRDAFVSWDEAFCLDVTIRYWEKARKAGLPVGDDFGAFYRAVEWMGLQRHLKVAGIFARLSLRDGKPQYLQDTPRFIAYMRATCRRYRELGPLLRLIDELEGVQEPTGFAFGRM